jgi:hypothetical protein
MTMLTKVAEEGDIFLKQDVTGPCLIGIRGDEIKRGRHAEVIRLGSGISTKMVSIETK